MGTPGDKFPVGKIVQGVPSGETQASSAEESSELLPSSEMTILQNVPSLGIFIEHDLEQQSISQQDKGLLLEPDPSLNLQSLADLEKQLLLPDSDSPSNNVPSLLVNPYSSIPLTSAKYIRETDDSSFRHSDITLPSTPTSANQPVTSIKYFIPANIQNLPTLDVPTSSISIIPELSLPGPSGLQTPKSSKSIPALIKIAPKRNKKPPPKKTYVCPVCDKNFQTSAKLTSHQLIHSGGTPFKCEHCKKSFSSKFKLVRHVLIHSDRKPFSCTVCERTFHRKDHLKNHIKVHSPSKKVYTCERANCKKEYTSVMSYRKHQALHSAEEGSLECKICSKVFETKPDILYHLKIHAGSRTVKNPNEKKFTCDYCDRKFFTRKDVRRHLVVHTGTRNFLCQFCPQRFGRKDHLVRHIKKSHSKKYSEIETTPETQLLETQDTSLTSQSDQSYIDVKPEMKIELPQIEVDQILEFPIEKIDIKLEEITDVNLLYSREFELSPMLCSESDGLQFMSHASSDSNLLPEGSLTTESELLTELGDLEQGMGHEVSSSAVVDDPAGLICSGMDALQSQQLLPSDMIDSDLLRLISDDENNLPLPGFSQVFKQQDPPV